MEIYVSGFFVFFPKKIHAKQKKSFPGGPEPFRVGALAMQRGALAIQRGALAMQRGLWIFSRER